MDRHIKDLSIKVLPKNLSKIQELLGDVQFRRAAANRIKAEDLIYEAAKAETRLDGMRVGKSFRYGSIYQFNNSNRELTPTPGRPKSYCTGANARCLRVYLVRKTRGWYLQELKIDRFCYDDEPSTIRVTVKAHMSIVNNMKYEVITDVTIDAITAELEDLPLQLLNKKKVSMAEIAYARLLEGK